MAQTLQRIKLQWQQHVADCASCFGVVQQLPFVPLSAAKVGSDWTGKRRTRHSARSASWLSTSAWKGTNCSNAFAASSSDWWSGRGLFSNERRSCGHSARCAKGKARKKSSGGRPKPAAWPFEDLMMFWDVAFERWCEDPERVKLVTDIAKRGLAAYGPGAVLVRETVKARTVARAGASFGELMQPQRPPDDEKQFDSLAYEVEYMPRWKIERPTEADTHDEVPADAPPVVSYEGLRPMISSLDWNRMLTLTTIPEPSSTSTTAKAEDGSELLVDVIEPEEVGPSPSEALGFEFTGEEPYKSKDGELVLLMAVTVDGQLAVGADVVKQVGDGVSQWKLMTRDELFT